MAATVALRGREGQIHDGAVEEDDHRHHDRHDHDPCRLRGIAQFHG
jgi:hypothetical protein